MREPSASRSESNAAAETVTLTFDRFSSILAASTIKEYRMPSMNARGLSRTDALTGLAGTVVLGCIGVSLVLADPTGRNERLSESFANLRAIGSAIGSYRADNDGYLPIEWTTATRRPSPDGRGLAGFASWQFGGKNNSDHWYSTFSILDVEAADRPLNPYLYPSYTFYAPPSPARLPAADPARSTAQARVFRDPADVRGHARRWPAPNPVGISSYDDVGTSYHMQMNWYGQLDPAGSVRLSLMREGTRRLAVDQGVIPSRFVHVFDEIADLVMYDRASAQIAGNHGAFNQSVTLFADGHVGLVTYRPGRTLESWTNPDYSVWFEDRGRPAPTRTPRLAPR
jgi:hypothetical protein